MVVPHVSAFCSLLFRTTHHRVLAFDSTLGYPGEGPTHCHPWSIFSANIGSIKTATCWKTWDSAITCLQETRIGKNCINNAKHVVAQTGKSLFPGALLPGLFASNGVLRTPHGGVGIAAPAETTIPFSVKEDVSGKYERLFHTKRVQAVWVQITASLKALVFNIYCKTAASQDKDVLRANNEMLSDIFVIASQFGDIPVLIAGDFQTEPLQYEAVANAINFHQWSDPIDQHNDQSPNRPITFSANGTFPGFGDGCSSIDAILTNRVASSAIVDAEVLAHFKVQHRPIRLTMSWERIWQTGFTLFKTAPFNLQGFRPELETAQNNSVPWSQQDDIEVCWGKVNTACIQTMLDQGATWGPGPQTRGQPIQFRPKRVCPGQLKPGQATTLYCSWLYNALGGLREIEIFLSQNLTSANRKWIQHRTFVRVWNRLARLRAPCLWPASRRPTLVDVTVAIQWVQDRIAVNEIKIKLKRIRTWQGKIQESAKCGSGFLFQHLKNKASTEPANLVVDSQGNAIFDPQAALLEINSQWDPVFSANAGFPHALKMLDIVWPHIHKFHLDYQVPTLSGEDLYQVVKHRKKHAAPGLDGWRTGEMQLLPQGCFDWFAAFFRRLEDSNEPLPRVLATARQVILNKNGSSEPLQKRLITLLPVILLAYTGARFIHLRQWQMHIMPIQLQGGIPQRHMAAIHTQLAFSLEHMRNHKCDLIGVKIDKAKCFDRIIPEYAGALMLAFGVPRCIVSMFLKLYQGLSKHLSYKSWVQPLATHGPNGVAQGCSLSLIAINVHMKAWVHLLAVLPNVTAQAFVDDAYLWARLIHKDDLFQAIRITQTWDALVGQEMNWAKCTIWGTSTDARKCIKQLFPNMRFAFELEVLGVHIQTSFRTTSHFSEDKVAKIIADVKNIACLPITTAQKAKIIGAKVIPQCTYNAAINNISARALARIQGEIVTTLWHNRPHWRAKFLVFAFLCKPHRVEPGCARQYNAILDVCRYLHLFPEEWSRFHQLLQNPNKHKGALTSRLQDAFHFFGLRLSNDGMLEYNGSALCRLEQLSPRDIRPVLQQLARQVCYTLASQQSRKDLRPPTGILDFWLSTSFSRTSEAETDDIPNRAYFEAQLVGCVLTKDRLAAAKRIPDANCRLCDHPKESLPHLVRECQGIRDIHHPPPVHELGPNFELLGIVEHPLSVLAQRLQVSDPNELVLQPWDPSIPSCTVWTDGSVQWPNHFLLTCAGFAVINHDGSTLCKGSVHHWNLSSYTAELWALIVAFSSASGPLQVRTDCKTVADQVLFMIQQDTIEDSWPLQPWWKFLCALVTARKQNCEQPLDCVWVPAHIAEEIPDILLTPAVAKDHGTTVLDILNHRRADLVAKQAAIQNAAIHHSVYSELCAAALHRQQWLTGVCKLVGCTLPPKDLDSDEEPDVDAVQPADRYPLLPWNDNQRLYTWASPVPFGDQPVSGWTAPQPDWLQFTKFLQNLKWWVHDSARISYAELAILFLGQGYRLSDFHDEFFTFKSLICCVKKWFGLLQRKGLTPLHPGKHDAHDHCAWGKTMPSGIIAGARPWRTKSDLELLTNIANRVVRANLSAWEFAVHEFM